MDPIIEFYNTLFTIEIAVFGIIAAAIFVFVQIIHSQFSYREIGLILKNALLISYFFVSTVTLLLTAMGSLILSFPELSVNIGETTLDDIFRNEVFGISLIAALLVSLLLFLISLFFNIRYIRPSKIALVISKRINTEQIKRYIVKVYGVPAPYSWLYRIKIHHVTVHSNDNVNKEEVLEESTDKEAKKRKDEEKLLENMKQYEKTKKEAENAQNPLEPLDGLMLKAIDNLDINTIEEIQSTLLRITKDFINKYKNKNRLDEWDPDSLLIKNYLNHIKYTMNIHLDMCEKQGTNIVKLKIIDITRQIARFLTEKNINDVTVILGFWRELADKSIGKSQELFNKVLLAYRSLLEYAFENGIEEQQQWLDESFRNIGWLGERLISQQGIEQKPIMIEHNYLSEYEQIFEVIWYCGYEYSEKYPLAYPLIYFDAVSVIFKQLIAVSKTDTNNSQKNNIFDCMHMYFSFAKAAILKENSDGAALAISNMRESYEIVMKEGLEESAEEAIGMLVDLGSIAYRYKDKLEKVHFMRNTIEEEVMDIVQKSPYRERVESEVKESYRHADFNWEFVVEMGKRLKTNFGYMFDWETGELYPNDDPRRRQ